MDAKYQTIGSMAHNIAQILQGKHKPIYHKSSKQATNQPTNQMKQFIKKWV